MTNFGSKRSLLKRYCNSLKLKDSHHQRECRVSTKINPNPKPFSEIPGPKPLPVIGNIWRYFPFVGEYSFEKLHRTYEKMYQQYGPIVREKIIGKASVVHVFNPKDIKEVYLTEGRYPLRKSHQALAKYRRDRPSVYKSVGLFPSNGPEWLRFRQLFQKILLQPETAEMYYGTLEEVTDDLVRRIPHLTDEKFELDLQPELFKWAVECVGAITLNRRLGCLSLEGNEEVEKLVKAAHDTHYSVFVTETSPFFRYFETPSYKKLVSAQDYLSSVVEKYIKEAMANTGEAGLKDSILSRMLKVPGADFKDVFTMVLDIFMAGIDTTAYTTAFGLYNLTKNPQVQQKLRDELIRELPDKKSKISDKIQSFTYLINVVRETLRLNPVSFGNGRVLVQDVVLSNYKVPAGTHVILQHQAASHHPENFKDPLVFDPDRWLPERDRSERKPFASAPFGAGPRSCVGRRFAQREMMFAIGKIIRNFEIEYHYEDIDTKMRLINVPDKPLKLRFLEVRS